MIDWSSFQCIFTKELGFSFCWWWWWTSNVIELIDCSSFQCIFDRNYWTLLSSAAPNVIGWPIKTFPFSSISLARYWHKGADKSPFLNFYGKFHPNHLILKIPSKSINSLPSTIPPSYGDQLWKLCYSFKKVHKPNLVKSQILRGNDFFNFSLEKEDWNQDYEQEK